MTLWPAYFAEMGYINVSLQEVSFGMEPGFQLCIHTRKSEKANIAVLCHIWVGLGVSGSMLQALSCISCPPWPSLGQCVREALCTPWPQVYNHTQATAHTSDLAHLQYI